MFDERSKDEADLREEIQHLRKALSELQRDNTLLFAQKNRAAEIAKSKEKQLLDVLDATSTPHVYVT